MPNRPTTSKPSKSMAEIKERVLAELAGKPGRTDIRLGVTGGELDVKARFTPDESAQEPVESQALKDVAPHKYGKSRLVLILENHYHRPIAELIAGGSCRETAARLGFGVNYATIALWRKKFRSSKQ